MRKLITAIKVMFKEDKTKDMRKESREIINTTEVAVAKTIEIPNKNKKLNKKDIATLKKTKDSLLFDEKVQLFGLSVIRDIISNNNIKPSKLPVYKYATPFSICRELKMFNKRLDNTYKFLFNCEDYFVLTSGQTYTIIKGSIYRMIISLGLSFKLNNLNGNSNYLIVEENGNLIVGAGMSLSLGKVGRLAIESAMKCQK